MPINMMIFRVLFFTALFAGILLAAENVSSVELKPLFKWADESRLGRPFSKDPSVIRFAGRYLMYFSLPPFSTDLASANTPRGWSIGIAESTNLVDWKKVGELWPAQACDTNGLCAPGARVLNGKVHLFYQTYGNFPKDSICHAVSADGIHFMRDESNPVFHPTGDWNNGRAIDAEVIADGERLLLYFATRDSTGKTQELGVATAPLNSDFSRQFENTPGGGGERTDGERVAYGFAPLLGANFTFKELLKGNFGATLRYNTSTSYDLSISSQNIVETLTQEISLTASYSRKGFEIPFFGLSLSNDVDVSFTYSISKNSRNTYDVSQLDVNVTGVPLEGSTRTQMEPRIKYVLSQRVTASVYYTYTRVQPDFAGSSIPGTTENEAGLDIHIAIQ